MPREFSDLAAAGQIPEYQRVVPTPRQRGLPVRRKGKRTDMVRMSKLGDDFGWKLLFCRCFYGGCESRCRFASTRSGGGSGFRLRAKLDRPGAHLALTQHPQPGNRAGRAAGCELQELRRAAGGLAIDLKHDIAALEASRGGGRAGVDLGYFRPAGPTRRAPAPPRG